MEFDGKYVSETEKAYLVLNPVKDKLGNVIPETRTVLADDVFAICEAIKELKNTLLKFK